MACSQIAWDQVLWVFHRGSETPGGGFLAAGRAVREMRGSSVAKRWLVLLHQGGLQGVRVLSVTIKYCSAGRYPHPGISSPRPKRMGSIGLLTCLLDVGGAKEGGRCGVGQSVPCGT
jgi:hypothetical protein